MCGKDNKGRLGLVGLDGAFWFGFVEFSDASGRDGVLGSALLFVCFFPSVAVDYSMYVSCGPQRAPVQ